MPWTDFKRNAESAFKQPEILKDLAEYDDSCTTVDQLYRLQLLNKIQVDVHRSRGVLITDDYPFTEFFLWRHLLGLRKSLE